MQLGQIPHTFQTAGPFNLGGGEIVVLFLGGIGTIVLSIFALPVGIFYLLTVRNALWKCSPESRTMSPGNVWLLLIPFFNLGWHFVVVMNLVKSLRNEFERRGFCTAEAEPGQTLGPAMCILGAAGVIPVIGLLFGLAGMVCWIIYWMKISKYSGALSLQPQIAQGPA